MTQTTETPAQSAAEAWTPFGELNCLVSVEVPLATFTVRQLLSLCSDTVLRTRCSQLDEPPVKVNGVEIATAAFEVVGDRLVARVMNLVEGTKQ